MLPENKAEENRIVSFKYTAEKRKITERKKQENSAMDTVYEEEILVPIEIVITY